MEICSEMKSLKNGLVHFIFFGFITTHRHKKRVDNGLLYHINLVGHERICYLEHGQSLYVANIRKLLPEGTHVIYMII